jgi:uncharacterized protein DUF2252
VNKSVALAVAVYHLREQAGREFESRVADAFARYRESLPERRVLLDRYKRKDLAIKVVGVGSVGTFCAVVLMMADMATRCSCRSRRPEHPSGSPTRVRAIMRTTAKGW